MNSLAASPPPAPQRPTVASAWSGLLDRGGMLLVLAALGTACGLTVRGFGSPENLMNLLLQVSTVGIVATTMLFCLASGNFDLSVGAVIPCSGVICALLLRETDNVFLAVGSALGFGAITGLVNGTVVARFRVNPLIATLSTMMIVRGIAFVFADGKSIGIANERLLATANAAFPVVRDSAGSVLFQITTPVWACLGLFVIFGVLLKRTTFGRNTLAIGGNEEAARLAGIHVTAIKITIFTVQGVVAALAGVLLAARLGIGDPKTAQGIELSIISACVLGGVSLAGGVGRMTHVIAGVFIMGVAENAMNLMNIDSFYQYIVRGSILLAAVLLDQMKQRRS